jgi:hypothetical protein
MSDIAEFNALKDERDMLTNDQIIEMANEAMKTADTPSEWAIAFARFIGAATKEECAKGGGQDAMSLLEIWNNPMHPPEFRLEVAVAEIESLRQRVADEKLCHEETRERLNEVATDWQVIHRQLAVVENDAKRQRKALKQIAEVTTCSVSKNIALAALGKQP